jgi:broad specificity phosphatase PhoE
MLEGRAIASVPAMSMRAVALIMDAHPGGRVVAASHGDVIPVLLATLSNSFAIPRSVTSAAAAGTRCGSWLVTSPSLRMIRVTMGENLYCE